MKKKGFYIGMVILGTFLAGCVSTPLDNKLMDKNLSTVDHAVLFINRYITGVYIDGDTVKSGRNSSGEGTLLDLTLGTSEPMVVLTPGEHTVIGYYYSSQYQRSSSNEHVKTYSTLASGYMGITYDFEAGRYYYLKPEVKNNTVSFSITDETDSQTPEVVKMIKKAQKRVAKVKAPSKAAPSLTYGPLIANAATASPTKFEGTWKYYTPFNIWSGATVNTYIFSGNLYFHDTVGTFELNDNVITLTALQENGAGGSLVNLSKPKSTQYEYYITDEGLFLKTKIKTLGPFNMETQDSEGLLFVSINGNKEYAVSGYNGTSNVVNIPSAYNGKPVTKISIMAFQGKTSLTSITIPASVTSIGDFAFNSCQNITSITIPASVTTVGTGAFIGWRASQTIYIEGYASEWAADDAWSPNKLPGFKWQLHCNAIRKYWNGSEYR